MDLGTPRVTALVVAACFAAGLNVYATVAALGVLARTHAIAVPPSLDVVTHGWVIAVSVALYGIEFVADKIPAIDLVWNALQTFVRVPVAAVFAYAAAGSLSPAEQLFTASLGAGVALVAHGGKIAARVAVTPSPEPFSNAALSIGEDALAVFLVWLTGRHPYWAATIVAAFIVVIFALARIVVRSIRAAVGGVRRQLAATPR
jgi:hypothetical protein